MKKPFDASLLPHHRLRAYGVAVKLLAAVREAQVRDRVLRDQALRAVKSALKRGFGLRRCLWRGLQSYQAYVQASVLACNLLTVARHALAAVKTA